MRRRSAPREDGFDQGCGALHAPAVIAEQPPPLLGQRPRRSRIAQQLRRGPPQARGIPDPAPGWAALEHLHDVADLSGVRPEQDWAPGEDRLEQILSAERNQGASHEGDGRAGVERRELSHRVQEQEFTGPQRI